MENLKHTQGPWEVHGNGIFKQNQSTNICVVSRQCFDSNPNGPIRYKDDIECEANAKLIASAPELLEALQKLVFKYEFNLTKTQKKNLYRDEEYSNAINAIKKATE